MNARSLALRTLMPDNDVESLVGQAKMAAVYVPWLYEVADDLDRLERENAALRDVAGRLIRAEETLGGLHEDSPSYGEALSTVAKIHGELQALFPETPAREDGQ